MKINVGEKYESNIIKKFGNNSFESSSEFSEKEKLMWTFTLWLLKDRWPKKVFDTEEDCVFLTNYLAVFMTEDWGASFTLEEWENYLSSK